MKINKRRIIKYLFFTNIFLLIMITAAVFLFTDNKIVINSLILPYNTIKIFMIYTSVFLPLSAGSLFFVFTLTEKKNFNPGTINTFIADLNKIIIPIFAVYSILILYMSPLFIEKKIWLENLSETARFYRKGIIQNAENDIEKAFVFSDLYLYIDPDNEEINKIHDDLNIILLGKNGRVYEKTDNKEKVFLTQLLTGDKLIEISNDFLKRNDYSSAIYYSEIAGKFKNSKKDSTYIIKKASDVLKGYVETDPDKTVLFNGKLHAEELFNNKRYLDSYYKTISLKEKFPEDSELDTQKSKLIEKLKPISFFYEEIEEFIFVPGKENIIFREIHDDKTMIISCGKIVFADNEVYLFNINSYYPVSGKSWSAPFGKIISNTINMNCISKNEEKYFLPVFENSREKLTSIPLSFTGEDLINFSGDSDSIKKISLLNLFTKTQILEKGKFGETALIIEAAERIIRCINFLMILFISVYSGISFMKRGRRINYMSLFLFPLVLISAAAAEFILFNLNAGLFENLIISSGKLKTFIIFPLFLIFEFITALYLTIKRSAAKND